MMKVLLLTIFLAIPALALAQTAPSQSQYPGANLVRGVTADRCYVSPDAGVTWSPMPAQPWAVYESATPTGANESKQTRQLLEQILLANRVIILELEALRASGTAQPIPGLNDVFATGGVSP